MAAQDSVRRSKYVSHRRNSLAAVVGDDDDMRDEIDRLNSTQSELQRELESVMKMVEVMHGKNASSLGHDDDLQASFSSAASSSMHNDGMSQFPVVEEEEEEDMTTPKKSFAEGFFQLMMAPETLETQKRRQMELLKENLKDIDPDLRDVVDCHNEMQDNFIQKQKQLEELKVQKQQKLKELSNKRTSTLEEEKQKQMEILKLSIGPDLTDVVDCQAETQSEFVARKKQEMEQVQAAVDEKLRELDLANRKEPDIWVSTRRSLERMMSFKTRNAQEAN